MYNPNQLILSTRPVELADLDSINTILSAWLRDVETDELLVADIAEADKTIVTTLTSRSDGEFYVAVNPDNHVLGVIGLLPLSDNLRQYAESERPFEIVNNYVRFGERAKGVGKALLNCVEASALQYDATELIVSSGAKYKKTAWGFYEKFFGSPVATLEGYYGTETITQVWQKVF